MGDYISREAAYNAIAKWGIGYPSEILAIPAADVVEVVHGEWIHNETYELANGDLVGEAYCSKCELYSTQISNEGKVSYVFCPRCGAKIVTFKTVPLEVPQ